LSLCGALRGEVVAADEPLGFEKTNDLAQMFVARGEERGTFGERKFIRCAIATGALEEGERTVVHHEMLSKECSGVAKARYEQIPQALAANLASRAGESGHESFGMLARGAADFCFDPKPIAHGRNLTKRDAGLRHAERTRIHAEKQDALSSVCIAAQIHF